MIYTTKGKWPSIQYISNRGVLHDNRPVQPSDEHGCMEILRRTSVLSGDPLACLVMKKERDGFSVACPSKRCARKRSSLARLMKGCFNRSAAPSLAIASLSRHFATKSCIVCIHSMPVSPQTPAMRLVFLGVFPLAHYKLLHSPLRLLGNSSACTCMFEDGGAIKSFSCYIILQQATSVFRPLASRMGVGTSTAQQCSTHQSDRAQAS